MDSRSGFPIGTALKHVAIPGEVTSVAATSLGKRQMVYGFADGTALVVQPDSDVTYPNDKRVTEAVVKYPLGQETPGAGMSRGGAITHLVYALPVRWLSLPPPLPMVRPC